MKFGYSEEELTKLYCLFHDAQEWFLKAIDSHPQNSQEKALQQIETSLDCFKQAISILDKPGYDDDVPLRLRGFQRRASFWLSQHIALKLCPESAQEWRLRLHDISEYHELLQQLERWLIRLNTSSASVFQSWKQFKGMTAASTSAAQRYHRAFKALPTWIHCCLWKKGYIVLLCTLGLLIGIKAYHYFAMPYSALGYFIFYEGEELHSPNPEMEGLRHKSKQQFQIKADGSSQYLRLLVSQKTSGPQRFLLGIRLRQGRTVNFEALSAYNDQGELIAQWDFKDALNVKAWTLYAVQRASIYEITEARLAHLQQLETDRQYFQTQASYFGHSDPESIRFEANLISSLNTVLAESFESEKAFHEMLSEAAPDINWKHRTYLRWVFQKPWYTPVGFKGSARWLSPLIEAEGISEITLKLSIH